MIRGLLRPCYARTRNDNIGRHLIRGFVLAITAISRESNEIVMSIQVRDLILFFGILECFIKFATFLINEFSLAATPATTPPCGMRY